MINSFKIKIWVKFTYFFILYLYISIVSNPMHCFMNLKKAGKVRSLGIRPTVRGVAMNPCDHPHGGEKVKNHHQLLLEVLEVD